MNTIWGSEREPELNRYLSMWAAVQIFGEPDSFGPCTTMGVFDDGKLIAVMVYHNMDQRRGVIEISGAATDPRWLTRAVLKEMFDYPFLQLKVQALVMRVSEEDKRLGRILHAYGFESHVIPRLRGRNEAEVIYLLTDDAWAANKFTSRKSLKISSSIEETAAA